jgi:hypothetical protein
MSVVRPLFVTSIFGKKITAEVSVKFYFNGWSAAD